MVYDLKVDLDYILLIELFDEKHLMIKNELSFFFEEL